MHHVQSQLTILPCLKHQRGSQVRNGPCRFPQIWTVEKEVLTSNHILEGSLTVSIQSSKNMLGYVLQQLVRLLQINTKLCRHSWLGPFLDNGYFGLSKKKLQWETPANPMDYSSGAKRASSILLEYFSARKVDLGETQSTWNKNSRCFFFLLWLEPT